VCGLKFLTRDLRYIISLFIKGWVETRGQTEFPS